MVVPHPQPHSSKVGSSTTHSTQSKHGVGKKGQPKPKAEKRPSEETIDYEGNEHRWKCWPFIKQWSTARKDWYTMVDIKLPWLIKYLAKYGIIWEFFMYVVVIANHVSLLYGIFFVYYDTYAWSIVHFSDIAYGIDVILRLCIEVWRHVQQSNLHVLTIHYEFLYGVLDCVSLLPVLAFVNYLYDEDDLTHLYSLDLFRLNSAIRLYRTFIFFKHLDDAKIVSEEVLFLMRFSNLYFAFINLVGCIFFTFVGVTPVDFKLWTNLDKIENSWAQNFKGKKPGYGQDPMDMYILSLHFSAATTTTVGFGDFHAETIGEMLFCIFIMLFGAIFLSGYFSGQITNFQLELDGARFDLFHRLDGIEHHLAEMSMSEFFQAKVELYYKCLWTYREGVDQVVFFDSLPRSLQEDMYYDICTEMFYKSFLFRGLDEAFLRAVSKIMKIALYNPDMILCRYGGYANQMYYILQGECSAMSKHESSKRAAVLRAGSIIGEINLFFSCPYSVSIETRTCCQFINLDKEELMGVVSKFKVELQILRNRCMKKVNMMYQDFEVLGEDPVCWVQRVVEPTPNADANKKGKEMSKKGFQPPPKTIARWGDGFNPTVQDDVLLDVDRFVIFETSCEVKRLKKNHVTPYMTCVVPEILNSDIPFITYWNIIIMTFALIYSFIGPYCLSFGASSHLEHYICQATEIFKAVNIMIFMIDVIVEILGACPVEGIYYKFHDGLRMKCRETLFYFDILAALPIEIVTDLADLAEKQPQHPSLIANTIFKSMKIWKVIRYLQFLDNVYPKDLFWFRLGQTFIVLMYGIHFIACFMFYLACPIENNIKDEAETVCREQSWLASYKITAELEQVTPNPDHEPVTLGKNYPYLLSFYFSAATLTSAGFGDFTPQTTTEILASICFQLIGFYIIGYYTALLTSALACVVKSRLEFQQKLVAVKRFMEYYGMSELLQRRIVEHYELQYQSYHEVILPVGVPHFMYDSPDYLKQDVLYTEVVVMLDGIPLFSKTESKSIIRMSEIMARYLIPPNVKFLHRGEVRRSMYVVRFGSMGVFDSKKPESPTFVLESTGFFGLRDLLFGEPAHYDFKTLSYCLLYEIKHKNFMEVFKDDDELLDHLEAHKGGLKTELDEMRKNYAHLERGQKKDRSIDIPSWIYFKPSKSDNMQQLRYTEYANYFDNFAGGRFWKLFLLNGVAHPVGLFTSLWTSWISIVTCLTLCLIFMETFMYIRNPYFRICQTLLEQFYYIDIYVKMHMAYYVKHGILITHPLKTAGRYIFEGPFFIDSMMCSHPEFILYLFGWTSFSGYGPASTWHTKLRWIKFMQIRKIPSIFQTIHTIFVYRNFILLILYVSMSVLVCTIVGSVAIELSCPWSDNDWTEGDEWRLPYCLEGTWIATKGGAKGAAENMSTVWSRWIAGVYYVCQVILVIGYGDMITLTPREVYLVIIMAVFGFIFMRCVIADITAADIDSDEVRSRYIDQIKNLKAMMMRENVHPKLIISVQEHMNHTWKKSKGLHPQELFTDLHPSLESDLYRAYVGDKLKKVPVFTDFAPNVLRSMCQYVRKLYFVSGERLSRFGNLEYEMHIIIAGKVWITDRLLNYGCTLHKNESFGETAVISHNPRRFTVIAATNVEVFVITHDDFSLILERYPIVRTMMMERTGNAAYDFFEFKIYDTIDKLKLMSGAEKNKQIDILTGRTNEIKNNVYGREQPPEDDDELENTLKSRKITFVKKFILAWGSDDDDLPFLYFVSQRSRSTGKLTYFPPLIHPNCILLRLFLFIFHLLCFFFPAISVYEFCFPPDKTDDPSFVSRAVEFTGNNMEHTMIVYIVLRFFMPYKDSESNFVKSTWSVVVNYITSLRGFWLDSLASVPYFIEFYVDAQTEKKRKELLDPVNSKFYLYPLGRLLWLYRYYAYQLSKQDDLSISAFEFKIMLSVSTFFLMAHFLACIFYKIADCNTKPDEYPPPDNNFCKKNTWTYEYSEINDIELNAEEMFPYKWYVRSLYWVVTVVSTTGFGDITPTSITEMGVGIICIFCGAFILSIILSQFTAGMASLTKAHREFLYQVKLLVRYLRNIGLSALRQDQINFYFSQVWDSCRGSLYHNTTKVLPTAMEIEVNNALYRDVLKKVKLFDIQDKCFIRQVARRLTHSVYLPGVCIVKEGDPGSNLYIVYKGFVSGVVEDDSTQSLKSIYVVGDVFGRFPALFHDDGYKKSYRAEQYTEILALSQYDIIHLASVYKEFWKILLAYVERHYDPNGESDCVFSEPRNKNRDIFDLSVDFEKADQEAVKKKETEKKADKLKKKKAKEVEVMKKQLASVHFAKDKHPPLVGHHPSLDKPAAQRLVDSHGHGPTYAHSAPTVKISPVPSSNTMSTTAIEITDMTSSIDGLIEAIREGNKVKSNETAKNVLKKRRPAHKIKTKNKPKLRPKVIHPSHPTSHGSRASKTAKVTPTHSHRYSDEFTDYPEVAKRKTAKLISHKLANRLDEPIKHLYMRDPDYHETSKLKSTKGKKGLKEEIKEKSKGFMGRIFGKFLSPDSAKQEESPPPQPPPTSKSKSKSGTSKKKKRKKK